MKMPKNRKQETAAESKPEVFPDNHWFENTPENIKEFLQRFPGEKSITGYDVDSKWLSELGSYYKYFVKTGGVFQRGANTAVVRSKEDRTEFIFEHQKAKDVKDFRVGDYVVITDNSGGHYENGDVCQVVEDRGIGALELKCDKYSFGQLYNKRKLRIATEYDLRGSAILTPEVGQAIASDLKPTGGSPMSPVISWLKEYEKISEQMKTTTELQSSLTISPETSAAQASGQASSVGDDNMLTQSEKDEILALIAQKRSNGGNLPGKALGFAGRSAKGLVKWCLGPAGKVWKFSTTILQYAVFLGLVGSAGYGGYWAWSNGRDYLPTIEFKQREEQSPSDEKARQITEFATTGLINS